MKKDITTLVLSGTAMLMSLVTLALNYFNGISDNVSVIGSVVVLVISIILLIFSIKELCKEKKVTK